MDIAVAAFYLLNKAALGVVDVAHERPITNVIGKGGKEKLSRLHYYPNQRNVYPVKQIFICN